MANSTKTNKTAVSMRAKSGVCKTNDTYKACGVTISRKALKNGDPVILCYEGLLAKDGANKITAHIGYGELWDDRQNIIMENRSGIFEAPFDVQGNDSLNICFKDGADNWDNNSGLNYSFKISKKRAKKVEV